jgi:predicted DsbA family dithiol-disulfide isomerase
MSIAKALANDGDKILDYDRFVRAWADGSGVSAFRNDLQQTRFLKIGRYPTLTFTGEASKGIIITGYRPFDVLKEALDHMFEQTRKKQNPS